MALHWPDSYAVPSNHTWDRFSLASERNTWLDGTNWANFWVAQNHTVHRQSLRFYISAHSFNLVLQWSSVMIPTPMLATQKTNNLKRMWHQFNHLLFLPNENDEDGLKASSYAVKTYTSEPAPKHFVEALTNVMADKQCQPPQKDPLGIIPAWKAYNAIRPLVFTKKAVLTPTELSMKHAVDKRFITYMQVRFFLDLAIGDCSIC